MADVVNYASRIGTGLAGSGIAQGALFAVTGARLGPSDSPVTASFPLPSSDGLGGVTITITAADGSVSNAIMAYASDREVDAILPSGTPVGPATITLNYNGASASVKVNVVASAFGILASAGFFNLNADGTLTQNTPYSPAQPGQTVYLAGTGLGAIASDETQPGATDMSTATVGLWVGSGQATVVSAGRGSCCNAPANLPAGISALDVVAFTVPDGADGCMVSVAAQIGSSFSNIANFSVAANGSVCAEAALSNGGTPVSVNGTARVGVVSMTKTTTATGVAGAAVNTVTDSGTATFNQAPVPANTVYVPAYSSLLSASAGSCTANATRFDKSIVLPTPTPNPGPPPTPLDAGPALNLSNGKVAQVLRKQANVYIGSTVTTTITAAPGLPPVSTGGPDFLPAGTMNLDNGAGGTDIPAFKIPVFNPTAVKWDSMSKNLAIDRSKGVLVAWSGGDPDGIVAITGSSANTQGTVTYAGSYVCFAKASWGQFQVPAFVTSMLPASQQLAAGIGTGFMSVGAFYTNSLQVPTIDLTYYVSQNVTGSPVNYQ